MTFKVYGIGLSRTGTTTLNKVLNQWGWPTKHYPNPRELFDPSSAGATDIPASAHFRDLDLKFPNSKFIYTIRDKEKWLDSIVPYLERKRGWQQSQGQVDLRRRLYGDPFPDRRQASIAWDRHDADVRDWFGDRILVIDIVGGDSPQKLADFLGVNTNMTVFPHHNELKK
jgi:hypothetical protein